jgi:hypothetical protein
MPPQISAAAGAHRVAERVVSSRKHGGGQQYEIKWVGQAATTWEGAQRMRTQAPAVVQAFEEARRQESEETNEDESKEGDSREGEALVVDESKQSAPSAGGMAAAEASSVQALQQLISQQAQQMREQGQQLQQLISHQAQQTREAAAAAAATGAAAAAAGEAPLAEPQSRFARKEPRAQDLREYDGAAGAKLDEWLQELAQTTDLFELNPREASKFAASRLRGAALRWWQKMSPSQLVALKDTESLAKALRARFQPITAARTAREQLDKLLMGNRHVNDYISDFQNLHTLLPSMSEEDAMYAFERGLRRDLAEKLRVQGVSSLQEAIAMAARVGGLLQSTATPHGRAAAAANQMDVDSSDGASLDDRIAKAVLNAMNTRQPSTGGTGGMAAPGAQTQTHRDYRSDHGRGTMRGGRGGRFGGRPREPPAVPGVSVEIVKQRLEAQQCVRCGADGHRSPACPNAISASGK